jgi:hypothetical protein
VCHFQCDQIGRIFAVWANFSVFGHICFEKYYPNVWAQFFPKNRPKFTYISSTFGLLFVFKFPNFDQKFLWAFFLFTEAPFWATLGQNWAIFFTKRLVALWPFCSFL